MNFLTFTNLLVLFLAIIGGYFVCAQSNASNVTYWDVDPEETPFNSTVDADVDSALSTAGNVTEQCFNPDGTPLELTEIEISNYIFSRKHGRRWTRPVKHATETLEVDVYARLQRLLEVDERNQLVRINGYLKFKWKDELRAWNDVYPYNCVKYIVFPHGKETGVWLPEIALINAGERYKWSANEKEQLRMWSDGVVAFAPGGFIEFLCKMNLASFPFDKQLCYIRLEPWRYTARYMRFRDANLKAVNLTDNEQWEITKLSYQHDVVSYFSNEESPIQFSPTGNAYTGVEFYIHLRRKPGYYLFTIIIPCLLVAVVEVFSFSIPHNKGIRLEVSFTCLLAFTVFQTIIIDHLPKSADHPPLLMVLISILTYLIGFAIFCQSMTLFMADKGEEATMFPPHSLMAFTSKMAPIVLMSSFKYMDLLPIINRKAAVFTITPSENIEALSPEEAKIRKAAKNGKPSKKTARFLVKASWRFLARATDRFCCALFIILFGLGSILVLIVVPKAQGA